MNFEVKVGEKGLFKTTNGHILRLSVMSVMAIEASQTVPKLSSDCSQTVQNEG